MLEIKGFDHAGIRVRDRVQSVDFYEKFGFNFERDAALEEGHPVILRQTSGVVLDLLVPSSPMSESNISMDIFGKHTVRVDGHVSGYCTGVPRPREN